MGVLNTFKPDGTAASVAVERIGLLAGFLKGNILCRWVELSAFK